MGCDIQSLKKSINKSEISGFSQLIISVIFKKVPIFISTICSTARVMWRWIIDTYSEKELGLNVLVYIVQSCNCECKQPETKLLLFNQRTQHAAHCKAIPSGTNAVI